MARLIRKKGQSTLEYVVVLTALVAAFIAGTVVVKNAISGASGDAGLMGVAANKIPEWTGTLAGVVK